MKLGTSVLWQTIRTGGRRPFMIMPEREWSYAELSDAVNRWLTLFDEAGFGEEQRILIRTKAEFAAVSCFVAALLDGRVPVLLAPDCSDARLLALAENCEARCIVHDGPDLLPDPASRPFQHRVGSVAQPAESGVFSRLRKRDPLDVLGLSPPRAAREPAQPASGDGLAYLLFTSGTTSSPIGVQVTRANIFANLATITRLFGYDANSRIFNDMFLSHADGLVQGPLLALANGCAFVRSGGFALHRLEAWLERVRATRCTHFITVPTIWMMIDAHAAHHDYFDAPEFVSAQSVAAKLPIEVWQRLEARFGMPIASHYGLTETVTSALYAGPHPEMGPIDTLGMPIDCEARIDPTAGDEGELQLRGSNVTPGYWRNAERDAQSFTRDGWLRTGDLARRNADGSYTILGRTKNIIMTGGMLIRPDEIDEAMLTHPLVRESVTLAHEDAVFGEVPVTFVVTDGEIGEEALVVHARDLLEERKVPRDLRIVSAIPRGVSGKPVLSALREQLEGATSTPTPASTSLDQQVLALAADIFRQPIDSLALGQGPDEIAGWDSFSHLNLVLEVERQFGIRIPAARIASIACLRDICTEVGRLAVVPGG